MHIKSSEIVSESAVSDCTHDVWEQRRVRHPFCFSVRMSSIIKSDVFINKLINRNNKKIVLILSCERVLIK